jgi:hypothetical protein
MAVGVTDMRKGFEGFARLGEGATRQGRRGSGNGRARGTFFRFVHNRSETPAHLKVAM